MNPGVTAFTRIPNGATSAPTDFVNSTIAPLAVE